MRLVSLTLLTASSMLLLKQLAMGTYRKLWDLNSVVIILDTESSVAVPVKQGARVTKHSVASMECNRSFPLTESSILLKGCIVKAVGVLGSLRAENIYT